MIGVRQRRGQAFETMMLVISVIVAVAILGVLLGFLGGISFGATGARDTMKSLVSKIYQRGGGSEISKRADFDAGLIIKQEDIIGETPIVAANIAFDCIDNDICSGSGGAAMKLEGNKKITVSNKVSAAIAVCKAYTGTSAKTYHICIGDSADPEGVSNGCDGKCK